jgi:cytochrome c peroxidase
MHAILATLAVSRESAIASNEKPVITPLMRRYLPLLVVVLAACAETPDEAAPGEVRAALLAAGLSPLTARETPDPALVALGQALFFDAALSGNRDTSCASCHVPEFATADGVSLAIGTGGRGTGPNRVPGQGRRPVPRNTLDLADRGHPAYQRMGWDGAVELLPDGSFSAPADFFTEMPAGLNSPLAAYSLLPAFDRDQMRGRIGDLDIFGEPNEIAQVDEFDLDGLSEAIGARLRAIDGYAALFANAFPERQLETFTHVDGANALAAFIDAAFRSDPTPYDRFLRGDDQALEPAALRGGALFAGRGRCASCHSGELLTDQEFYNLGTPQLRPGMLDEEPLDFGRGRETGRADERYTFRTPPLRNVAISGAWMHNGAYTLLENAVAAHLDIAGNIDTYDRTQLKPELQALVLRDATTRARLRSTLSLDAAPPVRMTEGEIADLVAFLDAMTSEQLAEWELWLPATTPSGLFGR